MSEQTIQLRLLTDENQECHSCGKVGRPRRVIKLDHLCQHYIALCETCLEKLKGLLKIGVWLEYS